MRVLAPLERLALRHKLMIGFAVLLALALALGVQSLRTQAKLASDLKHLYNQELVGALNLHEARVQLPHIVLALHKAIDTDNAHVRLEAIKLVQKARQHLQDQLALAQPTLWRTENLVRASELESLIGRHQQVGEQALQLAAQGHQEQAQLLLNGDEFERLDTRADTLLEQMAQLKQTALRDLVTHIATYAKQSSILTYVLLLGGLALALILAWLVSKSIRNPLERVRHAVDQLAAGQLDQPIPHTDMHNETGDLARAIATLQIEARQLELQRQVKAHVSLLQVDLQQAETPQELAQVFFAHMAPSLGTCQGGSTACSKAQAACDCWAVMPMIPHIRWPQRLPSARGCLVSVRLIVSRASWRGWPSHSGMCVPSWGAYRPATCWCNPCCVAIDCSGYWSWPVFAHRERSRPCCCKRCCRGWRAPWPSWSAARLS